MLLKDFYSVENSLQTEEGHSTEIKINKHHQIYDGHFPMRPVTPGVILMQLFKEEVERLSQQPLELVKAVNVKFMAVVDPNEEEILTLRSTIATNSGTISLKGIAEHKGCIALKINAFYKIKL